MRPFYFGEKRVNKIMQDKKKEVVEFHEPTQAGTEQQPITMRRTIGKTTYIVNAYFSPTGKETMADMICRMIKRDIESGNY